MIEAWVVYLIAAVVIAALTAYLVRRSYVNRGRAWSAYVRTERALRVRRVRRLQAQGKAPPSVTLQVEKNTHNSFTTFGGRKRVRKDGEVGE